MNIFHRAGASLNRHPLVRDALVWAIPAILFGAFLRILLISYLPYAYWGSDSPSYFSFADKLLADGYISLDEKRRFLYPILLLPVAILPGATLKWLAVFQHGLGLISLVPLAYIVRRVFVQWRLWVVPATLICAGMPIFLWYEHELLAECVFFSTILWSFAGWVAWVKQEKNQRKCLLWWWFFIPFALMILTKPSGRFFWPGILTGLLLVLAWRQLNKKQMAGIALLMVVTLFVGSRKQGAWLFYVASFPLTQLDTPLRAEYKAGIRDMVEPLQNHLDAYYILDKMAFKFLSNPGEKATDPLWMALGRNEKLRAKVYMDLALEGVKAHPWRFLYFSLQRTICTANPSRFNEYRFEPDTYPKRFADEYVETVNSLAKGKWTPVPRALGLPAGQPVPPYEETAKKLSPAPNSFAAKTVVAWTRAFQNHSDLVTMPSRELPEEERSVTLIRPTWIGWWMMIAMALSIVVTRYRNTMGIWVFTVTFAVFGAFLVSQINPRYFAPAWPVLIPALFVPLDLLVTMIGGAVRSRPATNISQPEQAKSLKTTQPS